MDLHCYQSDSLLHLFSIKIRSKRNHTQLDERILHGIKGTKGSGRPGTKYRGNRLFEGCFLRITLGLPTEFQFDLPGSGSGQAPSLDRDS